MLKQLFRNSLFIFILLLLTSGTGYPGAVKKVKGPVVITSEKLTADNQAHTALFERSVIARTSDMTIHADRMLVHSDKDSGEVNRIDAYGNVKLFKGARVITSLEAIYYADSETVVFTGDPKAVEDGNVISGNKMTYLMNEDRFLVDDSKVFLTKGETP